MALTPKAAKTGIFLLVIAAIVGGGLYFKNNKPDFLKKEDKPAITEAAPVVAPEPVTGAPKGTAKPSEYLYDAVDKQAKLTDERSEKKQHVAKTPVKKVRKHEADNMSREEKAIHKEMNKDQEAIKGLAGGSL